MSFGFRATAGLSGCGFKPHGQWMPPWLRLYALGWVPASLLVALSPGDALATQAVALGPRACAGLEQRAI